ncbi:uncharacterized [Tachysurus ichikawai]
MVQSNLHGITISLSMFCRMTPVLSWYLVAMVTGDNLFWFLGFPYQTALRFVTKDFALKYAEYPEHVFIILCARNSIVRSWILVGQNFLELSRVHAR